MFKKKQNKLVELIEVREEELYKLLIGLDPVEHEQLITNAREEIILLGEQKRLLLEDSSWKDKIDINVLINSGIGVLSILLILNYEKTDILTSKALSLGMRMIGR